GRGDEPGRDRAARRRRARRRPPGAGGPRRGTGDDAGSLRGAGLARSRPRRPLRPGRLPADPGAPPRRSAAVNLAGIEERLGASEFCIVLAVRGPDDGVMEQVLAAVEALHGATRLRVACSLGILTRAQAEALAGAGVHRYNHNLEAARSYFPAICSTHTWEE